MEIRKIAPFICLSTLLGIVSCEKDNVDLQAAAQEGYLEIEMIFNPSIHPHARSVNLNIEASRIGEISNANLITSAPILFDALSEPTPMLLGTRAALSPGGYVDTEFDFTTTGLLSSYVETPDGEHDLLESSTGTTHTTTVEGNFLIEDGVTTKRVMFLNMDKLLKTSANGVIDFSFRENPTKDNAIRLYDPNEIGSISGELTRSSETPRQTHRLVVYAYPVGLFNRSQEVANEFSSAIISANVRRNDQFTFPVLPEGAYELVVVEYQDQDLDNFLEFKNLLVADTDVNETTRLTRVSKNTETQVLVKLGGVVAD